MERLPDDSLDVVWEEAAGELARLVRAMGMAGERGDDVLQDVYLTAWQKRPTDLPACDLRRWLFRVAINRCHLEHRRRRRWRHVWHNWLSGTVPVFAPAKTGLSPLATVATAACHQEDKELVRRALDKLKPQLRTILVLRYFADFDSKEIGNILDLPDSTVRSHLRAGRQQLALELRRAGYEPD